MNLLIVESPSKAKTIEKYLGEDWHVIASVGHVRDLIPENGSVDTNKNFEMKWGILEGKEKQIRKIIEEVNLSDNIYLASDPDREGEAIAWHILDILKSRNILQNKNVYRVVFHEITKNSIIDAIKKPREIDTNLVDAYLVRRALDYLIGFKISPLLWRKRLGRSVGRVQSVAVRIIIDKEKEIKKFIPQEYWSLSSNCIKNNFKFLAKLSYFNGRKIEKLTISNKNDIDNIIKEISLPINSEVSNILKKNSNKRPFPPFTTSTLQQESSKKLFFTSKKTMMIAQKLYENGFITYMRTDSFNLSNEAISSIRKYIENKFGKKFLPSKPNIYITKIKNAQEAHEAIRPTNLNQETTNLSDDEKKLYNLILKRTISCQMTNAEYETVSIDIKLENKNIYFHSSGTTCLFEGFTKIYNENNDEEEKENLLPVLNLKDKILIESLNPEQHETKPPARYTEASLIKKLEELGIGRPSTYSNIISTIIDRKYVEQNNQHKFIPTNEGWILNSYLNNYFNDLVDINFTAKTEDTLDEVSNGKVEKISALSNFWIPTEKSINSAKDIRTSDILDKINNDTSDFLFDEKICPKCGGKLSIKISKYGSFIGCSNYPNCDYNIKISNNNSLESIDKKDIDLGENIFIKKGKFGPYITDGKKNVSIKKYKIEDITIEKAKELLNSINKKEVIELGINPKTGKQIYFYPTGRYGSYISSNKINISVKDKPDLEKAIELINNKNNAKK